MHIEITIHCPELAQLAEALRTNNPSKPGTVLNPPPAPIAAPLAPVAPVVPQNPVAPPVTNAPTAAPAYTLDQLTKAGADLAQAGKMEQLLALLTQYGVQAVTQVPPEQYGAFAAALRGLGAQL